MRRFYHGVAAPTVLGLTAALLGAGCSGDGPPGTAQASVHGEATPEAIAVRAGQVTRDRISSLYSTSTTLRPERQATIIARTKGVIRSLLVEEGDRVTAEQPVAILEDDEQKIALNRYRTVLEIKQREFERSRDLHAQGVFSDSEFELIRREVEEARNDFERAELDLKRTEIRATFDGIIVQRQLDVGATVNDGTGVYDLADLDPLYADVNVPERHVIRLATGQTVRLTADATDEVVDATIERIAPSVDPGSGTVKVTLAVDRTAVIRPGAFVRVDVITDTHTNALVVRRSALVAEGRRWHIFRVPADADEVEMLEVELGYEEGDRVEIVGVVNPETTLEAGDRVVVVGASALTEGARVRVMEEENVEW